MDSKKNVFIVILFVSIIFLSLITLYFGGYSTSSKNKEETLQLRDHWWLFVVVTVILIVLLDKVFWRKDDKRNIPVEGRLIKLEREQNQENHRETEDEYKL